MANCRAWAPTRGAPVRSRPTFACVASSENLWYPANPGMYLVRGWRWFGQLLGWDTSSGSPSPVPSRTCLPARDPRELIVSGGVD